MRFRRLRMVLFLVAVLAALASQAARFLVADEPQPSDAIVVLATLARPVCPVPRPREYRSSRIAGPQGRAART